VPPGKAPFFSLALPDGTSAMIEPTSNIDDPLLRDTTRKIMAGNRISPEEGLYLYKKASLSMLSLLAGFVRKKHNENYVFFNRNFHIEPTNKCIYNCRFCSYHKSEGDIQSWEYSHEEMMGIVRRFDNLEVTEVHIVGGVHPSHNIHYYGELIKKIKEHRPGIHVKAFSAIELDHMIKVTGFPIHKGLEILKNYGLDSIPGGGAEIFDEEIRRKICPEKTSADSWLEIHRTAHSLGIPSNATMLYGHIETYEHRINHMQMLRDLQDITGGFNAFIPLKFKKADNSMSYIGEVSVMEDLRNYAVTRIFLDNFKHIKAYWPMSGKDIAQISLLFGTDDLDGTIEDTTRIYSMAGSDERNPAMTTDEICKLIHEAGFVPVERDSLYNFIHTFAL
jgi:aminodeoxyfutalosine synthase